MLLRFPPPQFRVVPVEGVVGAELVAHLVGHEVHVEGIPDRVGRARHAPRLDRVVADAAQRCDAAAARAEDVADVVVRAADHAVEVGLVLAQHRGTVVVGVRIRRRRVDDRGLVRDQIHVHRQLAFVDRVHPVHGGGHGGERRAGRPALVERVLVVGGQCQAVAALDVARRRRDHAELAAQLVAERVRVHGSAGHGATMPGRGSTPVVLFVVGDVVARVARRPGIDEDGAARGQDHRVEARGRPVEANGGGRVVDALPPVGADLRELPRQLGLHDGRFLHPEALEAAVGHRQRQHDRLASQLLQRRAGERGSQRIAVQLEGAVTPGDQDAPGGGRADSLGGHAAPGVLLVGAQDAGDPQQQGERSGDGAEPLHGRTAVPPVYGVVTRIMTFP